MADPLMLDLNKEYVLKYRPKPKPRPMEVIEMMKPYAREKYLPATPVVDPVQGSSSGDDPDSEPELVEPPTPGVASLMDILGAEADEDDDFVFLASDDDLEDEENPSKRRRTV